MIFQYTWKQVIAGEKTSTRRPVKAGEVAETDAQGAIVAVIHKGRTKYRVGQVLAVQPARTAPAIARIRLLRIERRAVTDITDAEAQAEGNADRAGFLRLWELAHGAGRLDVDTWALHFELVETLPALDKLTSTDGE